MGSLLTSPASFVANTRARAAEVNAKFSAIATALRDGSNDIYVNGYRQSRLSTANVTLTGYDAFFGVFYTIGTNTTFDLATSTSRMVNVGDLEVSTGATLHVASGAQVLVL